MAVKRFTHWQDSSGDSVGSWDGYRRHTHARSTGALVVLVDGVAQCLTSAEDADAARRAGRGEDVDRWGDGRWFLICDDHGSLLSNPNQADLVKFMAAPEEWCEDCARIVEQRRSVVA